MDYQAELYYNPLFNFLDYFDNQKFTDFEVVFPSTNQPPIKAHAIILANSSGWVRNILDTGMSRKFEVYDNPMNLMPRVIRFMYNGQIEYTNEEVIPLLHISNTYDIPSLQTRMVAHLKANVNHDNIFTFSNKCYEYRLKDELINPDYGLVPLYIANFSRISIKNLTTALDVCTFCLILKGLNPNEYNTEAKFDLLDKFIGDSWECDAVEKKACHDLFDWGDSRVRALFSSGKYRWLK